MQMFVKPGWHSSPVVVLRYILTNIAFIMPFGRFKEAKSTWQNVTL